MENRDYYGNGILIEERNSDVQEETKLRIQRYQDILPGLAKKGKENQGNAKLQ